MWQEIAIIIVGIAALVYVGVKVYRFITRPKDSSPCSGCSGCSLKNQVEKKEDCPGAPRT